MKKAKAVSMFCETCGDDRDYVSVTKRRTLKIRGEEIEAEVPLLECTVCGDVQPDPSREADPMAPFYAEYRRRHRLLAPEAIRGIRERYGLSHEAFAAVSGMSPATLYRYEAGALQDEVHDAVFVACEDRGFVEKLVALRSDRLTQIQRRRFGAALEKLGRVRRFQTQAKGLKTRRGQVRGMV